MHLKVLLIYDRDQVHKIITFERHDVVSKLSQVRVRLQDALSGQVAHPVPRQVVRLVLDKCNGVDGRPRSPLGQIRDAESVEFRRQESAGRLRL